MIGFIARDAHTRRTGPVRVGQRVWWVRSGQLWASDFDGVMHVHGEVDVATRRAFALIVEAAMASSSGGRSSITRLDLDGVTFIDMGGAEVLVNAAIEQRLGVELVLHNPAPMLVRILHIGWGSVPGLRLEPSDAPG